MTAGTARNGRAAPLTLLAGLVGLTDLQVGWRADGIEQLCLAESERWQAASPLPAFDHMVQFVANAVEAAPEGPVVVADHGLGGFAAAVGAHGGRVPIALVSDRNHRHAGRLAPRCPTIAGGVGSLPVPCGSLAALVVLGIGDDVTFARRAASDSLIRGGCMCVVGIVSADAHVRSVGNFEVKSLEWLRDELSEPSFAEPEWAIAATDVGEWMAIDGDVAGRIARLRRGDDRFDEWCDQRRVVHRLIEDGELLVAARAAYKVGPD